MANDIINSFLLNNGGYTVERLIHGMTASYNAVPIWDYGGLFQAFGPSYKTKHYLAKTPDELDAILTDAEFNEASYAQVSYFLATIILLQLTEMQIVELILDPADAPDSVKRTTAAVEAFNQKK
jgi:pyruvate decarboxylase